MNTKNKVNHLKLQDGFTLIELMIVTSIIAILMVIAIPIYQSYSIDTKRGDMMADMMDIASNLEATKLAKGKFKDVAVTNYIGKYPKGSSSYLYDVTITPSPLAANWKIIATPEAGSTMADDGTLTLDFEGKKCRATACGYNKEWSE